MIKSPSEITIIIELEKIWWTQNRNLYAINMKDIQIHFRTVPVSDELGTTV